MKNMFEFPPFYFLGDKNGCLGAVRAEQQLRNKPLQMRLTQDVDTPQINN